ncbi:MAG TPA: Mur ligase family protein [Thermoanaerobaculia bacterium]|nr:Mur ligase family protein [Thermoanaerobaculia bacterium]
MNLLDSRRLTGPNLLLDRPGAILEVSLAPEEGAAAIPVWAAQARRLLDAVGWTGTEIAMRRFDGGASLAITAPIDGLYAATEINDWAWGAAEAAVLGLAAPDFPAAVARLRDEIAREANPALIALQAEAASRGVAFLADDHFASVGLGKGSLVWPVRALPEAGDVDWNHVYDTPVLLVTGTNGKTTTVRLLAAIVDASEQMAGTTSTDLVEVGGEVVDRGDFSGPGGARALLRDRRVEVAILETARGGLLRRGLAVSRADAALVTNIAADHLGEFGILDLPALTEAKLVIARAVGPKGRIVLNADDPELVAAAAKRGGLCAPIVWFSLDAANPVVKKALAAGGEVCFLDGGALVLARGKGKSRERIAVTQVEDVPVAFGGAARHNVANALAAIAMASTIGIPADAMATGLRRVGNSPEQNPGRANVFERDGVRILLDYAHNPHGLTALLDIASSFPAERRLLLLGQAGDRTDEAIRDLARAALPFAADRIVIKELPEMLRGRPPGEIPALLEDELRRHGVPAGRIERADSELEGARRLLEQARPGDLVVLLVHTQREAVLGALGFPPDTTLGG